MKTHHVSHVAVFTRTVRDFMDPAPPTLRAGDGCGAAVELLRDPAVSGVVILEGARPRGIVTEQDVTHRIAFRQPAEAPVEQVMSSPIVTIGRQDYLFQAIAMMRRHNLRHLPVLDDAGTLCGILHLHKALGASMPMLLDMVDVLTPEDLRRGIGQMKAAQVEIASGLLEDRVPTPEIQSLLTHFNNDIYRRVVTDAVSEMRRQGWGGPPVAFDVIVMGSGGREESFLFPDQDNGFVLEDYPDDEHTAVDTWFVELAERMVEALDGVGISRCRGFVMASNPLWRKTLSQWRAQLRYWLHRPNAATLRLSDIFFDFNAVYGEGHHGGALREALTGELPKHHAFLRAMQRVQRDHGVALGHFKRLTVDNTPGPHRGKLNLKYHGLLPLVENVRLLSLREGVAHTSTLQRIAALRERDVLSANEQDYLTGALHHITFLVLRQQLTDFKAGAPVGPYVPPAVLSQREKDMLVDALDAINDLRKRLDTEFSGNIF